MSIDTFIAAENEPIFWTKMSHCPTKMPALEYVLQAGAGDFFDWGDVMEALFGSVGPSPWEATYSTRVFKALRARTTRVWMSPNGGPRYGDEGWTECSRRKKGAERFWRIDLQRRTP